MKSTKIEKVLAGGAAVLLAGSMALGGCAGAASNSTVVTTSESASFKGVKSLSKIQSIETPTFPDWEEYYEKYGDNYYKKYSEAKEKWYEARNKRWENTGLNSTAIKVFSENSMQYFFASGNTNTVVSPINLYIAFAMLSEITDGDTRQQILDALGCENIEDARTNAENLIRANNFDDGSITSLIANSVWLRNDKKYKYKQKTLDDIASRYFAESYSGEMGSAEMNSALQGWLNEKTGGLLEEQASGVSTSPATILALASTIYYKGGWADKFEDVGELTFHGVEGDEEVNMMSREEKSSYFISDTFKAAQVAIENGGSMWVLVPEEGVKPEELLEDENAKYLIYRNGDTNTPLPDGTYPIAEASTYITSYGTIKLTVPKFDVSSDIELMEIMAQMGVTDVFNEGKADFSPLVEGDSPMAVTSAKHAARVVADEEGVLAAAFTVMMVDCAMMVEPEEPIEITADRPFLFAITGEDGSVLFIGTVYNPQEG